MKTILGGILSGFAFVGLIFLLFGGSGKSGLPSMSGGGNNVRIENGVQIVEISAKGGYSPRVSYAKAGVPTTLRMNTNGTFDCSASVVIPSLNYQESLPMSGTKDIPLPAQAAGKTIQGFCSMGMYSFEVDFQ
ncbi:MAG: cupredoxin domain-containing protein [Candidatus Peregrinibacteria bacterium]|nr:cupredoxin domain-containing protein [Candidatus Peregrinibacteria bacterium]